MNKVGMLIRLVHNHERNVVRKLLVIGERHRSDHEVYHVTRDLARWSDEHVRLLREQGQRLGIDLKVDDAGSGPRPLRAVREKLSELSSRRPESGLLLLWDMRGLHLDLIGLSLDWEILGQTAQAIKDDELLSLTQRCHPDTLRQAAWANEMVKVISPQAMAS
ncbi:hypothetical protein [Phytoactinopolyspora endophytica]|uniref:hypothetical protein n=1 Tax=Phytoactinopolyspora endophytica TaxID=1642495 RepID=UPI00101C897E|nr:hypothetical protein [Phytoactinopolyspora endophytica]